MWRGGGEISEIKFKVKKLFIFFIENNKYDGF